MSIFIKKGGSILYKKFAELLCKKGITCYRVSVDTGISTSTLTAWKKGTYEPKLDKLKILADYFGVPVNYFIDE